MTEILILAVLALAADNFAQRRFRKQAVDRMAVCERNWRSVEQRERDLRAWVFGMSVPHEQRSVKIYHN